MRPHCILATATLALLLLFPLAAKPDEPVDHATPASLADLKALEQRIRTVVEKVAASVVGVSGGSGVVVSEEGLVLTVAHVGEKAGRRVTVTFPDGKRVRGTTLGNDHGVDAGMIQIDGEGPWPHAEIGTSADLQQGEWCITLGYPVSYERGKKPVVRVGRVLRNRSTQIMADCKIMGGDSGGPLFDLDGKVIGIGSRCDDTVALNIHVPIDCYRDHWDRFVAKEDFNSLRPKIAFLGVGPGEDEDDNRIEMVVPGSAAEKAGIKPGDLIVKFGEEMIQRYEDLPPLIRGRKPGDVVELQLQRGDEELVVKVTLGSIGG